MQSPLHGEVLPTVSANPVDEKVGARAAFRILVHTNLWHRGGTQ